MRSVVIPATVCMLVAIMAAGVGLRPLAADQPAEAIAAPAAGRGRDASGPPGEVRPGYAVGYRIGQRILEEHRSLGAPLDFAAMARGLADAVAGGRPALDEQAFSRELAAFEAAMEKRRQEFMQRMAAAAKKNLAAGREFLAANTGRKGVVTLPSGLQYEVLKTGVGPNPLPDDIVFARYRGTHIDGTEFDGSDPAGDPASFPLRGVIPGWQEALGRMQPGAKWRVWLPPDLAYGEEGSPPAIEPNEVLVFEIELVRSQPAAGR